MAITESRDQSSIKSEVTVLSLDGGGIRGISSLLVLKRLAEIIEDVESKEPADSFKRSDDQALRLCNYFDYVVGTSTGGLAAIMLGRLEMRVDECLVAYEQLGKDVFEKKPGLRRWLGRPAYEPSKLEGWMHDKVERYSPRQGTQDYNSFVAGGRCKTLVSCAEVDMQTGQWGATPCLLRSYQWERVNNDDPDQSRNIPSALGRSVRSFAKDMPIWEVARATSAAPPYFKPISVGTQNFVDGSLIANNPTALAIQEIRQEWRVKTTEPVVPASEVFGMIVNVGHSSQDRPKSPHRIMSGSTISSIGSGFRKRNRTGTSFQQATDIWLSLENKEVDDMALTDMLSLAVDTESPLPYVRFSLDDDLQARDLARGSRTIDHLKAMAEVYLAREDVAADLQRTAKRLVSLRRSKASSRAATAQNPPRPRGPNEDLSQPKTSSSSQLLGSTQSIRHVSPKSQTAITMKSFNDIQVHSVRIPNAPLYVAPSDQPTLETILGLPKQKDYAAPPGLPPTSLKVWSLHLPRVDHEYHEFSKDLKGSLLSSVPPTQDVALASGRHQRSDSVQTSQANSLPVQGAASTRPVSSGSSSTLPKTENISHAKSGGLSNSAKIPQRRHRNPFAQAWDVMCNVDIEQDQDHWVLVHYFSLTAQLFPKRRYALDDHPMWVDKQLVSRKGHVTINRKIGGIRTPTAKLKVPKLPRVAKLQRRYDQLHLYLYEDVPPLLKV